MSNPDLAEHLRWAQTLGVTGFSKDPSWRARVDDARDDSGPAEAPLAENVRRFLQDFDELSIINCTDLFTEEAATQVQAASDRG